jgi:hypothetical protein
MSSLQILMVGVVAVFLLTVWWLIADIWDELHDQALLDEQWQQMIELLGGTDDTTTRTP